ncbi:mismatch-specific DNA-glycosylase [Aerophototrophica crusticola]|uniref:Mismatch-specific DNA-glycosylase n=1 Tax=Aerophototrophica crusticola TaxID=1709002 RepID=A0A858R620_9PROT|nr:mismatch-specific DNA-glycosylase [Rhodospirillaceae bacterium B3]
MILPDVLAPGLDLVLCGTAPSRISAAKAAYYANPGNRFWPTLHEVGLTPCRLDPAEYRRVLNYGIGLTDLNKTEFGCDHDLTPGAYDVAGFRAKMLACRPTAIAFDSKNAAKAFFRAPVVPYGRQDVTLEGIVIFVVPSPSGLARRFFDLGPWQELGDFVARLRNRREEVGGASQRG